MNCLRTILLFFGKTRKYHRKINKNITLHIFFKKKMVEPVHYSIEIHAISIKFEIRCIHDWLLVIFKIFLLNNFFLF